MINSPDANRKLFILDKSLQFFGVVISHTCPEQCWPILLWQISKAFPDVMFFQHGPWFSVHPTHFNGIKTRAWCRLVSNVHFGRFGGKFFTRIELCFKSFSCWKTKGRPRLSFVDDCLKFSFQLSFFLHGFFHF